MLEDWNPGILTQRELDIMKLLCEHGGADVRTVFNALPARRDVSYRSVMAAMKMLVDKGFITRSKKGQAYFYKPVVSFGQITVGQIRHVIDNYFNGDPRKIIDYVFENNYSGIHPSATVKSPLPESVGPYEKSGLWSRNKEAMPA